MTKYDQDFELYQGVAKVLTVPVVDSAGDPLDMDGATVYYGLFTSKSAAGTGSALLEKTAAAGEGITIISSGGTNNALRIELDAADTNGLLPDRYYHEARVTLDGKPAVVFEGRVRVKRSITASAS